MMRLCLAMLVVSVSLTGSASASEPPDYKQLSKEVELLKAQVRELQKAKSPPAYNVPPCGCGCMEGKECLCKNCADRTADPNWKKSTPPLTTPAVTRKQLVTVCENGVCRQIEIDVPVSGTTTPYDGGNCGPNLPYFGYNPYDGSTWGSWTPQYGSFTGSCGPGGCSSTPQMMYGQPFYGSQPVYGGPIFQGGGFHPFQRFREWNQNRFHIFGGRFRGGSCCGG